jgi:hypothetical protein
MPMNALATVHSVVVALVSVAGAAQAQPAVDPATVLPLRGRPMVVVSPVGTPADNGAALIAGMAAITSANANRPWLLKIDPGVYDLGASSLAVKPFVDVEGSGEEATVVRSAASSATISVPGSWTGELRALRVENLGGDTSAVAVDVAAGGTPRFRDLVVVATGGTGGNIGLRSSSPSVLTRVTATASGPNPRTIFLEGSQTLRDVQAVATGDAVTEADAIWLNGGGTHSLERVRATVTGERGAAIYINSCTAATLHDVTASISAIDGANAVRADACAVTAAGLFASATGGGGPLNYSAYFNWGGVLRLRASAVTSVGVGIANQTLFSTQPQLFADASQITGALNTVFSPAGATVRIGGSQLAGGPVAGPAVCATSYDENYVSPAANVCP